MLKPKLQYFGHLMQRTEFEKNWPWCWLRLKSGWEGYDRDEMVGWHHWFNGHEFEQAPGDGQGSLACCSCMGSQRIGHSWATELNWTDTYIVILRASIAHEPLYNLTLYRHIKKIGQKMKLKSKRDQSENKW